MGVAQAGTSWPREAPASAAFPRTTGLSGIHDVVSVALGAIRPLHSRSVGHNRETLAIHERVAIAIRRGHHRKAEDAMREIVETARADALREHA